MPRSKKPPGYRPITEAEWQAQVIELATLLGWRHRHERSSIQALAGWPDLTLWKPGRFLMAELKCERGKLSPAQVLMLASLEASRGAPLEIEVWRPSDLDRIEEILRRSR